MSNQSKLLQWIEVVFLFHFLYNERMTNESYPSNEVEQERLLDLGIEAFALTLSVRDCIESMNDEKIHPESKERLNEALNFLTVHKEKVLKSLSAHSDTIGNLILEISDYSLFIIDPEGEDETYTSEQKQEKLVQDSSAESLLSLFNGMTNFLEKNIRDSFEKEIESAFSLQILDKYIQLSLRQNIGSQYHSLLNTVKLGSLVADKMQYEDGLPKSGLCEKAYISLLRLGDPVASQNFIEGFFSSSDIHSYDEVYQFPSDGRINYSDDLKLNSLFDLGNEELENMGYSREEIIRAKDVIESKSRDKIIRDILNHYDLPKALYTEAWFNSGRPKYMDWWVSKNLDIIRTLERDRQGSAADLAINFGIYCPARYDKELLIEQSKRKTLEDGEKVGVMISAQDDWNGAFSDLSDIQNVLSAQSKELGISLCCFEYSYTKSHLRYLDRYFDGQQCEYILISEHGDKSIESGFIQGRKKHWDKVFGIGKNTTSIFLKNTGAIALDSCFAGEEGNTAQYLAEQLQVDTIGPSGATVANSDLRLLKDESTGNLTFLINFKYNEEENEKTVRYERKKL